MSDNKESNKWWDSLRFEEQFFEVIEWLSNKGLDTTSAHPHSLTQPEINEIYNSKHKTDEN